MLVGSLLQSARARFALTWERGLMGEELLRPGGGGDLEKKSKRVLRRDMAVAALWLHCGSKGDLHRERGLALTGKPAARTLRTSKGTPKKKKKLQKRKPPGTLRGFRSWRHYLPCANLARVLPSIETFYRSENYLHIGAR
ncbi:hypothetical protein NDU88_005940 [Pleurodeles waltl]|uniref:Uncharacterized protein n=1 Tax=Pleurodeles waltl TaxID=8319 RepID=A0AAV7MZV4_PLEWA|nr:hypothetical protein NDU88_005940 [Pleurodeles waltl]